MLQRSLWDYTVHIPAIPATVHPGDVVEWPHPIAGFEPVPDPTPDPEPAPAPPAKTTKTRAAAPEGVTDGTASA